MDITILRTLPIGTPLAYIGPRPAHDVVPAWMLDPLSFRGVRAFGVVEVFSSSGTKILDPAHVARP